MTALGARTAVAWPAVSKVVVSPHGIPSARARDQYPSSTVHSPSTSSGRGLVHRLLGSRRGPRQRMLLAARDSAKRPLVDLGACTADGCGGAGDGWLPTCACTVQSGPPSKLCVVCAVLVLGQWLHAEVVQWRPKGSSSAGQCANFGHVHGLCSSRGGGATRESQGQGGCCYRTHHHHHQQQRSGTGGQRRRMTLSARTSAHAVTMVALHPKKILLPEEPAS